MRISGAWLRGAAGVMLWVATAACPAAVDFVAERPSDDARHVATWVVEAADNRGQPFAIVDKKSARIYVFEAAGHLLGASAVLLGSTVGDLARVDMTERSVAGLGAFERTTPAGRFASEPGHNDKGEDIVWVDYAAALAIHRLRPAPARERRPARLGSADPGEHRISAGCVVVPVAFYEAVVAPSLGRSRGVVYVLPESGPVQALLGGIQVSSRDR
jgi:hypothetical protein